MAARQPEQLRHPPGGEIHPDPRRRPREGGRTTIDVSAAPAHRLLFRSVLVLSGLDSRRQRVRDLGPPDGSPFGLAAARPFSLPGTRAQAVARVFSLILFS